MKKPAKPDSENCKSNVKRAKPLAEDTSPAMKKGKIKGDPMKVKSGVRSEKTENPKYGDLSKSSVKKSSNKVAKREKLENPKGKSHD